MKTVSRPQRAREVAIWPSSLQQNWIAAVLLSLAILFAYQQIWHAGFIWDDDSHLTRNPCIVGPLGFKEIWTTQAATYYPLVLSSFWLQHAVWGLNPLPYHLVTLAAHLGCALLLWKVLRKLEIKGAWVGAAIWALHPVQVESVAWVTELKNTQSCFFYLASIFFFLKWYGVGKSWSAAHVYIASLFCALLASLSKSSTVMLPVVLGLCTWWTDGQWRWRNAPKLIPFFLVSIATSTWTIWEQKFHSGAIGASWSQSWSERVIIAGRVFWFYLGKLFWPHPLVFIYPRWRIDAANFLAYFPALAAFAVLLALWWNRNGRLRALFFGLIYFAVSLFPVLGFFNIYFFRYSFVGDHLQYLASIGPLVLVGSGIAVLASRLRANLLSATAFCALLLGCALLTWRQSRMYVSDETLWRTTLARDPDSWMAQNNLGVDLLKRGQPEEALVHFQKALDGNPNRTEVLNDIGVAYLRLGRPAESLPYLEQAKERDSTRPDVLSSLGSALLQTGRTDEAITYLEKAREKFPDYVPALSYLGAALLQKGRAEEASVPLLRAVAIEPENKSAHFNLANTLLQMRRVDEALSHLEKVLAMDPNDPEAEKNVAWVLATSPEDRVRNGDRAVELAERANKQTKSRDPIIVVTLAAAYAETGRFSDAVTTAETARQLAIDLNNSALAEGIRGYVELYNAKRPFRDIR
jgi:tetratricopeptide (TPR) repeat protein